MIASVAEHDPKPVAFCAAQGWPRNAAVEGPGWEGYARHDLDVLVVRHDLPLAESPPVGQSRQRTVVEVRQHVGRIEAIGFVIHLANGAGKGARRGPEHVLGVNVCRRRRCPGRGGAGSSRRARHQQAPGAQEVSTRDCGAKVLVLSLISLNYDFGMPKYDTTRRVHVNG